MTKFGIQMIACETSVCMSLLYSYVRVAYRIFLWGGDVIPHISAGSRGVWWHTPPENFCILCWI